MDTVKITFDNEIHEYNKNTSFYEISKDSKLENILGFKIGNEVYSLDKLADKDESIEFINYNDLIGNKMYKAGLKFLFQVALEEMFPNLTIHYEHSIPRGMLGEVVGDQVLTQDDIGKIKEKLVEIISSDERIEKLNVNPKEAIKYYQRRKEYEKADNIHNISDKIVTLYKLRGKLNYFYSLMPYSTKCINKFELVYLGNNRIVFLFPTVNSNGNVLEYVHYDKIIDSFLEGKNWLHNMNVPYITDLNRLVGTPKINNFINSCELMFTLNINRVVADIVKNTDIKFILIAGPSSSGKTTTCSRIAMNLEARGYNPIKISLDDYYVNRVDTPKDENGNYDFERIEALKIQDFNEDLKNLLAGKEVLLPKYNFITGVGELSKEPIVMQDKCIFLIEGLHAINERLTEEIDKKYKYKIYLSPFIPLSIDKHNYVSTLDLRLLRRIVRDNRTRGYNAEATITSWQSVRHGEENYIFPFIHQADTIINTALNYEVGVMKVFVEPLLFSVSVESPYYEEARRLIDSLKQFFPIPGEYVSDDSILREFIGGKNND